MHWFILLAASLALVGAHIIRLPRPSSSPLALIAFVLGGLSMVLALRVATNEIGFGRVTEFDQIVNRAVDLADRDPAPMMVFTGTSLSRRGIDDSRLTVALRASGLPHRAINLSLEAASLGEREAHLAAFIGQTGRVPDIVFVEIADARDVGPLDLVQEAPFSPRAIEHYSLPTAAHALSALDAEACAGWACLDLRLTTLAHGGLNALNTGLLSRGEVEAGAGAVPAYRPGTPRLDSTLGGPDAETRTDGLSLRIGARTGQRPTRMSEARTRQRRALHALGVRIVGYYLPPVIDPDQRTHAESLCAGELANQPCIPPTDPALLGALDRPVWLDEAHLLDDGAGVYARWLARQIMAALFNDRPVAETRDRDGDIELGSMP